MKGKQSINSKKETKMNRTVAHKTEAWKTTIEDIIQRNAEFRYQLLDRLKTDCDYYLGYGNRYPKHLWAHNEEQQIELMIKLHDSFDEDKKPEWITIDEILEYKKKMTITE